VSIDLIGYYEYNRRFYLALGLHMTTITAVFCKQQDKGRETDRAYANKPERRKLCAEHRLENIKEEWRREVIDKQAGNTYLLGIAATSQTTKSLSEKKSSSNGPVVDGGGFEDENN
jgi:activator of 2-hydroxyglutaryl-CoA dehydratase